MASILGGYHIVDDGSPPPPCTPDSSNPALRSPPRYRDESSPEPTLYALDKIPIYKPGPVTPSPPRRPSTATASSHSHSVGPQVVVCGPAIPFNPHGVNNKYVDIPNSLHHGVAEKNPNNGYLAAGSPATCPEVVGQQSSRPKRESAARTSRLTSPPAAGSPAKHMDTSRHASTSNKRTSSRTPSPPRRKRGRPRKEAPASASR